MKITNQIRDKIKSKASKETFAQEWENHKLNEQKLFEQVYHQSHSDTVLAQVKALPLAWRWHSNQLAVEFTNDKGCDEVCRLRHDELFLMPPPPCNKSVVCHVSESIGSKIKAHFAEYYEIYRRSLAYDLKLGALLSDIHTDKKLRQAWPDGARFYDEFITFFNEETNLPDFSKIDEMKPKVVSTLRMVK